MPIETALVLRHSCVGTTNPCSWNFLIAMLKKVSNEPPALVGKFNWYVPHFRRSQEIYGALLCAVAARVIAFCLHARSLRTSIIFPFLLVVILVARHFGATAAMVGTTLAAAIFSRFMLPPIGSFRIEEVTAKETLLWFLVAGITLGYLFAPVPPDQD
jgi:K+-sensing histidine kinase KdpD